MEYDVSSLVRGAPAVCCRAANGPLGAARPLSGRPQPDYSNLLWVTLYTDASFGNGVGSWAVWLRSSKGRIVQSGACPDDVKDSAHAEFFAVYMGVTLAIKEWSPFGVQINSDCMDVVNGFGRGYRWYRRKKIRKLQNKILRSGVRLRTKHVKAHTGGQDTRSYLNRRCDHYAKAARTRQADSR